MALWACVLAAEIEFSRLAAEAAGGRADGYGFVSGTEGHHRSGSDRFRHCSGARADTRARGSDETLPSLLFSYSTGSRWFLSPLMSCERTASAWAWTRTIPSWADSVRWRGYTSCRGWRRRGSAGWGDDRPEASPPPSAPALLARDDERGEDVCGVVHGARRGAGGARNTDSSTMRGFLAYLSHECRARRWCSRVWRF